ncbi:4a-hydroxytetrahydrobiopterin dehydratase [Methylococcus geothermalis]|uniref:Putative pterin-4-alpha-carbinolamine dehydratase n=1 Tax=Methylococcus geothermalis TaxID=2681310 RepID=A0A858Q485_9GAMM|nr:4a-hydroxytetrahydrobiopterin dehydratase [Methylococcus geothermalis]QJD28635.1 pterin-4-alpha-carbinolamine dehydratase [Methylococcus geothermalis]
MDTCSLTAKQCTPCQGGIPPLTAEEAEKLLVHVPQWELKDAATKLKRTFRFKNFMEALDFARKVGELCEAEGHHPDIGIGWGYCRVEFQTHKINGLHENDFIMAAKVDELSGAT